MGGPRSTGPTSAGPSGPTPTLEDRHTAWPIPARIDRAPLARGRVLLTGDAAMASDVMTGEGIGQALLTGRLAAEAIIAAGADQPDRVARHVRTVGAPPPRRRPPDVGAARAGPRPPARRPRLDGDPRPLRRVGPAQLRPLDVRGRAASRRPHPVPVAPTLPRPTRCVHAAAEAPGGAACQPDDLYLGGSPRPLYRRRDAHPSHRPARHRASRHARRDGRGVLPPPRRRGQRRWGHRHPRGLDDARRRAPGRDGQGPRAHRQAVRRRPVDRRCPARSRPASTT